MSHKTKDCLERPRKRGAKWTGADIKADEFIQEAKLDFEGKRDRWAGYDPEEYKEIVENWNEEVDEQANDSESSQNTEDEVETTTDLGQKVDLKARMTVRNLRLREDTAKYLKDLSSSAAVYDPKTRSLKSVEDATRTAFVPEEESSGDHTFAWESDRSSKKSSPHSVETVLTVPKF